MSNEFVILGYFGMVAGIARAIKRRDKYIYQLSNEIVAQHMTGNLGSGRITSFYCDVNIFSLEEKELTLKMSHEKKLILKGRNTCVEIMPLDMFEIIDDFMKREKELKKVIGVLLKDLELYKSTKEFIEQSERLSTA